jgi:hypothetical protein
LKFLNQHSGGFDVAVRFRFLRQSVQAKSTGNNKCENLVESACYLENSLIKILQLKLPLTIHNHLLLLQGKKLPNACNGLKVIFGHFVEVSFTRGQFFLGLLFHHFKVEAKESLNLWYVAGLQ